MDITIRVWSIADLDSLVRHANNWYVAKNLTDQFPYPYTREDALKFIEFAGKDDAVRLFAIDVKGEAVGGIGIHPQTDIFRKNIEVGYWLSEQYWNKGIMSHALRQVIEYAFANYDVVRVFARPFGTNIASQRVLEKAGFLLEGRFEKNLFKNGEFLDELIYAIRRPGPVVSDRIVII